jgi:protein-S-isoprenylcysteine O-methyltransferase Ste14
MHHITESILSFEGRLWTLWGIYWIASSRFVSRNKTAEGFASRLLHLLPLLLGFVLIFRVFHRDFISAPFYHSLNLRLLGLGITALGLLFSVWARVHLGRYWSGLITLKEGHRLIRSGPYALVRHPIYTGFLLGALGSALSNGSADAFAGFLVMLLAYLLKISREEAVLRREFGEEYERFRAEVKALVPYLY